MRAKPSSRSRCGHPLLRRAGVLGVAVAILGVAAPAQAATVIDTTPS